MKLRTSELKKFQSRLRRWFRTRKRDLPWRRTGDPYRIWLSEVMLQQTRVAAVLPYYRRFLEQFPSVQALARARTEEVLRLWAGLGYYSRARSLHRAAKEVVMRHGGTFPREMAALRALPGIGPYTAAAVLSIAYGAPHAVLDGNVARVLARLDAMRGDVRQPRRWRLLQKRAQELLDARAPGDWNQAMMELGATVCAPVAPQCDRCPVARRCEARKRGIEEEIPAPRKKRAPVEIAIAVAVLLDGDGRTLLVRDAPPRAPTTEKRNTEGTKSAQKPQRKPNRLPTGNTAALFSHLWQFPAARAASNTSRELRRQLRDVLGISANGFRALAPARHTVTYRQVELRPFIVRVVALPRLARAANGAGAKFKILPLNSIERVPISNATRKIAARARAFCGAATPGCARSDL